MKALATILKRDPAAKLKTARQLLAAAEARRAAVQRDRGAALVESDDIETLRRQDREIEELGHAAVTYRDRVFALEAEQRRQDHAERVRQHHEAIDKIISIAVDYVRTAQSSKRRSCIFSIFGSRFPRSAEVFMRLGRRPRWDRRFRTCTLITAQTRSRTTLQTSAIRQSRWPERIATNGTNFIGDCHKVVIPTPEPDDDHKTEQSEAA